MMANIGLESAQENPEFVQIIRHFLKTGLLLSPIFFNRSMNRKRLKRWLSRPYRNSRVLSCSLSYFRTKSTFSVPPKEYVLTLFNQMA